MYDGAEGTSAFDKEGSECYFAFMREQGVEDLADRSTELWRGVGRIANAVFATEAQTLRAAVEKLKIVRLARGDDDDTADHDLEAFQYDSKDRWFANVMRDFERLAGEWGAS